MRRRIYLVRHGQTVANANDVVQTPDDALTEKGLEQARILAERFVTISFETLASSDLPRAVDTARLIGIKTGHQPIQSPLLREMSYATALYGASRSGDEVSGYYAQKREHADDPNWQWGDEESFFTAHTRVESAFEWLKGLPGTVVAVTHGHFIRFFVTHLLLGKEMLPRQAYEAMYKLLTNNTAITALEERDGSWYLLTWNDHAHLG